MATIKRFLFQHGEKVACGLIGLFCLWSIFGNLLRDPNTLPQPGGEKAYAVDRQEVKRAIELSDKHLKSSDPIKDIEPVPPVADLVQMQHESYRRVRSPKLAWAFYNRPPTPREIPLPPPPPAEAEDPSDYWRTAAAAPIEWRVITGRDRILLICRTKGQEEGGIRYPQPDSVSVSCWKKRVGEGKEDLSEEALTTFRRREAGALEVDVSYEKREEEPKADRRFDRPEEENPFGEVVHEEEWRMRHREEPERAPERRRPERRFRPQDEFRRDRRETPRKTAPAANKEQAYYQRLNEEEKEVWQHMLDLAKPASFTKTKWKLVAKDMTAYDEAFFEDSFTEEAIQAILAGEPLPAPAEEDVRKRGGPAPAPARTEKDERPDGEEGPAPMPVPLPMPGPGPAVPDRPDIEAPTVTPDADDVAEQLKQKIPPYEPRVFVFLDEDADENTLYRYRMVARVHARDLPEAMREQEKYRDYDLRVENADITWKETRAAKGEQKELVRGGLALTASQFGDFLAKEKPTQYAVGYQPTNFLHIRRDPETNMLKGLRNAENRLTKVGVEYRTKPAFSLFTYTDLVLTPVRRRIRLVSVAMDPNSKLHTVRLHVIVVTREGEEVKTPRAYALTEPAAANTLGWRDWVVVEEVDGNRQPKWKEGRPVLRSWADYYAQREDLKPVPIGDIQKVGRGEWDFSTGWGLVDVRRCKFRVYRYKRLEDGERELVGGAPQIRDGGYYIVIRSLKRKDQYKRILQRKPEHGISGDIEKRTEVIWRPELEEWMQDAIEKRAKEAAAEETTEKEGEDDRPEEPEAKGEDNRAREPDDR